MTSPSGDVTPFPAYEARIYMDSADTDTDSDSHVSSSFPDSELDGPPRPCPWRTPQFNDRECARYFDCPSHVVERSLSDAGSIHEDAPHEPDTPVYSDHIGGEGSQTALAAGEPSLDRIAPDDSETPSAQPPQVLDAATEAAPPDVHDHDYPSESSGPLLDVSDLVNATPALQTTPPPTGFGPASLERGEPRHGFSTPHGEDGAGVGQDLVGEEQEASLPEPRRVRTPVSRERMDAPLPSPRRDRTLSESLPPLPRPPRSEIPPGTPSEWSVPRWQSDAEVTYCPICRAQFSFFVRKHHCRKCGRVVCNSCSPHRIIIPYQYIVRPPGSEVGVSQSMLIDGLGGGYFDVNSMSGGERVRLCNPCVPDPNTAPPQSPSSQATMSPRTAHQRSRSSAAGAYGIIPASNRHGAVFAPGMGIGNDPYQYLSSRSRSITMAHPASGSSQGSSSRRRSGTHQTPIERLLAGGASSSSYPSRYSPIGAVASSSRQRALPPTPQIAEEDECPICHRELPSRTLANFESLRESHITNCIQSHSAYGTPRSGQEGEASPAVPRRTGMYTYPATEKDCIDDAECTICLEEFTVGVPMARLECLCRFHRSCISAWFVNHPGRCPVHQHDGFGY